MMTGPESLVPNYGVHPCRSGGVGAPRAHASRAAARMSTALRCLAGLAVVLAPAAVRAQLTVDQTELTLSTRPADRRIAVFNVGNEGREAINVTIEIEDWDRSGLGENRFFKSGELTRSCARWLRVFPQSMRLEPNQTQGVRLVAEGADSLTQACWSVVFARMILPGAQGARRLQYVVRTGVKVYVEPPGLASDGAIEGMTLMAHAPMPADTANTSRPARDLAIVYRNTGGVHLMTHGTVEVRRADNSIAATVRVEEFPTLPGAVRQLVVPLPAVPKGRYLVLTLLDFGGAELVAGQVELEAP